LIDLHDLYPPHSKRKDSNASSERKHPSTTALKVSKDNTKQERPFNFEMQTKLTKAPLAIGGDLDSTLENQYSQELLPIIASPHQPADFA
jgi:hypothetical protein